MPLSTTQSGLPLVIACGHDEPGEATLLDQLATACRLYRAGDLPPPLRTPAASLSAAEAEAAALQRAVWAHHQSDDPARNTIGLSWERAATGDMSLALHDRAVAAAIHQSAAGSLPALVNDVLRVLASGGIDALHLLDAPPRRQVRTVRAHPLLHQLWTGERSSIWFCQGAWSDTEPANLADERSPRAILSGAFNPLHAGHRELAAAAADCCRATAVFELPLINADKPPLNFCEIQQRIEQFSAETVALSRSASFVEKSGLFPGSVFVVGFDTALRVLQPRYYGESLQARDDALALIREHACRFLVAGRCTARTFRTLADLSLPPKFRDLFDELPEQKFRRDISSTQLRQQAAAGRSRHS